MTSEPWWSGVPAAQARVECGGRRHVVRWQEGRLLAVDHEDADAERTLAALGGDRCACTDVLDAWERHADDLRVLVLARRGGADQLPASPPWPAAGWTGRPASQRSVAWAVLAKGPPAARPAPFTGRPGQPSGTDPDDELIGLLGLGGGLLSWLTQVWAKGLATVAGRFCLAAEGAGSRLDLLVVGPDLRERRRVHLDG